MRTQHQLSYRNAARTFVGLVAVGVWAVAPLGCTNDKTAAKSGDTTPQAPAGNTPSTSGAKKKIVFVFKIGGISYSEACKAGADQANADPAINADVQYQASTEGTSEKQADIIDQAIVGKADAIVVSPVDAKAIVPALDRAAAAGIQVFTWDSDAPGSKRKFYVAAVDDVQIGTDIADALAKSVGEKGKVLIFSGQRTAENLNKHVQGMEAGFKKYPNIKVAQPYYYNDDDKGKAVSTAVTALQANPDAVGVACANSVSPPAAGEALRKSNSIGKVKVWGLALPSETKTYLKDGSVTGLYLWDPKLLTYVTAKLVKDALDGKMPTEGEEIAGVPGKTSVNGATVIPPLRLEINKDNVDKMTF
jgi:ABC-type sugar transport system substrate-binding protein